MYHVIDAADVGKTKHLIQQAYDNNGIILCKHPAAMSNKAMAYHLPVITKSYDEWQDYKTENVYVDELEEFIKCVAPNVKGYSMTIE